MSVIKQVIVIRKDLKMRRGKECSQAAHASSAWLTARIGDSYLATHLSKVQLEWLDTGTTKITLQVDSEEALLELYSKAQEAKLEVYLITDSGKTEFDGVPTKTALALGPDKEELINPITQHLKLY